jgi:hypothetical protein
MPMLAGECKAMDPAMYGTLPYIFYNIYSGRDTMLDNMDPDMAKRCLPYIQNEAHRNRLLRNWRHNIYRHSRSAIINEVAGIMEFVDNCIEYIGFTLKR